MGVGCEVGIFRKFRVQKSVIINNWLGFDHGYYYKSIMSLIEKNKEIGGKDPTKICKNGDFRQIFGIFGRKKIFFKNRTRSYFEHC